MRSLTRKIGIRDTGEVRKITVLEAILLRFTEDALKGNTKTAAFLFNRLAASQADTPLDDAPLSDDDRAILDDFFRQYGTKQRRRQ